MKNNVVRKKRVAKFSAAKVADFSEALDPQDWARRATSIWRRSFVVKEPLAIDRQGPFTSEPSPLKSWGPRERLFLEEAMFVGITYTNLLRTTFKKNLVGSMPSIEFKYREYDCSTTDFDGKTLLGGVDVDNGYSRCSLDGSGQVQVEICKNVRLTQPLAKAGQLNRTQDVLLALAFDFWIDNLLH